MISCLLFISNFFLYQTEEVSPCMAGQCPPVSDSPISWVRDPCITWLEWRSGGAGWAGHYNTHYTYTHTHITHTPYTAHTVTRHTDPGTAPPTCHKDALKVCRSYEAIGFKSNGRKQTYTLIFIFPKCVFPIYNFAASGGVACWSGQMRCGRVTCERWGSELNDGAAWTLTDRRHTARASRHDGDITC